MLNFLKHVLTLLLKNNIDIQLLLLLLLFILSSLLLVFLTQLNMSRLLYTFTQSLKLGIPLTICIYMYMCVYAHVCTSIHSVCSILIKDYDNFTGLCRLHVLIEASKTPSQEFLDFGWHPVPTTQCWATINYLIYTSTSSLCVLYK